MGQTNARVSRYLVLSSEHDQRSVGLAAACFVLKMPVVSKSLPTDKKFRPYRQPEGECRGGESALLLPEVSTQLPWQLTQHMQ